MLERLEIENFFSIRDSQVIDLKIAANVPDLDLRFGPVFPGSKDRVPKVIAFFGANASGKSTILKALAFLAWFVRDSFHLSPDAGLPCERFNDEESAQRQIRFALQFGAPLDLTAPQGAVGDLGTFRYELILEPVDGAVRRVVHEALRQRRHGKGKWLRMFERRTGEPIRGGDAFPLTGYRNVTDKVRPNASVISTLAQFEHKHALKLRKAANTIISNILVDRAELSDADTFQFYVRNPDKLEALNREIERIDLGINSMRIEPGLSGMVAWFDHRGLARPMPWLLESHGTRSFIRCFPMIVFALERGGVAVIDELDVSIHPLVLPEIIGWFRNPERNRLNAQLWLTSLNASLLEELEKEEIFFCEKDSYGRTRVFGLQDVKAVRRIDNRYRKYLGGVYGAVPVIG